MEEPGADQAPSRVEVGRFRRRAMAEERALVILALELPYWILREEGRYLLLVRERDFPTATAELARYEAERREARHHRRELLPPPIFAPGQRTTFSLFFYGWVMVTCFLLQSRAPEAWIERGVAGSQEILAGEWWRTLTALTLHGDFGHWVANLLVGLLFAAALLPWIGSGWTWFGAVMAGALGNGLNALGFRHLPHHSIGASTAVFGVLGILVGWQVVALLRHSRHDHPFRLRLLLTPIAAGLALLAYLGTGDETASRVDLTAHLFGMLAGCGIGAVLAWTHLPQKTPPWGQKILALLALLLPSLAWWLALR